MENKYQELIQQPNGGLMVPDQPQVRALIKDRPGFAHVEVYLQVCWSVDYECYLMRWQTPHHGFLLGVM